MEAVCPSFFFPDVKIDPTCEIRVVEILQGAFQDPLRCQLEVQRLDGLDAQESNDGQYECLSYTWGSWVNYKTIEVNSVPGFPVTENLWGALRRLRREKQARRFWIDQISLNQQDYKEKEKQLPRMGDIYRLATKVVVWIGDAPDFASEQDEAEKRHRQLEYAVTHQDPPWYSRAWVIQEYVKASKPPVFCFGSYEAQGILLEPQTTFWKTMKSVLSKNAPLKFRSRFLALDKMRKDSRCLNLLSLAWYMQYVECKYPKDKVYSLYSILPVEERSMITVDYERTDAAVFGEATYASIACSSSLTILSLVTSDRGSRPLDLPTWAVNFDRRRESPPIFANTTYGSVKKFLLSPVSNLVENFNLERLIVVVAVGTEMTRLDAQHRWIETRPHVSATPTYCFQKNSLEIGGLRFGRIIDCILLSETLARVGRKKLEDGSPEAMTSKWIIRHLMSATAKPYELLQDPKFALPSFMNKSDEDKPKAELRDIITTYVYEAWHAAFLQQHNIPKAPPLNNTSPMWLQIQTMDPGRTTLVVTQHGFLGHGARELQQDDLIVLPFGGRKPIALRQVKGQDAGVYTFQGTISVYGIMEGELNKIMPGLKLKEERFILV